MAITKNYENIVMENVKFKYPNFSGREVISRKNGKVLNKEGDRNFGIIIDKDTADALVENGWNVKVTPGYEEGDPDQYWLPVAINFNFYQPPKVKMITGKKGMILTEDTIGELDSAYILKADVVVRPRYWTDDRTGEDRIKAYLHTLRVEVEPDYFADEDEDIIY